MEPTTIPMLIYGGAVTVIALISIWVLVKIVRSFVKLFKAFDGASFHRRATLPVLAFAIALWLYPGFGYLLYELVWGIGNTLISNLPRQIATATDHVAFACNPERGESCTRAIVQEVTNAMSDVGRGFVNPFTRNSSWVSTCAYFFAIWFVAVFVMRMAFVGGLASDQQEVSWRQKVVKRYWDMTPAGRANLWLVVVLVISAYLSVTSIAVVPILKEVVAAEADESDNLRKELSQSTIPSETRKVPEVGSATDPLRELRATQPLKPTTKEAGAQPVADVEQHNRLIEEQKFLRAMAERDIEDMTTRLTRHIGKYNDLVASYQLKQAELINVAVSTFDRSNQDRKGARERSDHRAQLGRWYRAWVWQVQAHLADCNLRISEFHTSVRSEAVRFVRLISSPPSDGNYGADLWRLAYEAEDDVYRVCSARSSSNSEQPPERPALGSHLGIIGWASSWLLETESMPLALIVGMIGFGLLGAVSSAFVREGVVRAPGEALVRNLPGVVILGSSAAMVIFLGVFGGIAMFAVTSVEPNPYVILFTCFVAAVFSEEAWKRAQGWFNSQFAGGDGSKGAKSDQGKETPEMGTTTSVTIVDEGAFGADKEAGSKEKSDDKSKGT